VSVERVFRAGASVRIQARVAGESRTCPACGVPSGRVHSRYERRLADVAAGGQEVLIHLQVRRFSCGNDGCERRTFAEQVPGLAGRHARRTTGLGEALAAVALALGGRAGARLTSRLASPASRRAYPMSAPGRVEDYAAAAGSASVICSSCGRGSPTEKITVRLK